MRCDDVGRLLDLFIDGELPEEMAVRVERHLLRCPDCAHAARGLEQTREYLRSAYPPVEADPGYRERAAARLAEALSDQLVIPEAEESQWRLPFPADR